jgi:GT2 family glycosyltransferase
MPKRFPSKRREYVSPLKVDSCIGACLMVRKEAMDDIGFFDERYFFFLEESDWACRMRLGSWGVYFVPRAEIFHAQGKTVGNSLNSRIMFYRSRYIFLKKWHPYSYPLFYSVVLLRLSANTLLSFTGLLLTLGFKDSIKKKFIVYIQLIIWHLLGCSNSR